MAISIKYPDRDTKQIDVTIGNLTIHFSYQTVIAFSHPSTGFVISENVWSTTTGRHLNDIDPDKSKRIPYGDFADILEDLMKSLGLE